MSLSRLKTYQFQNQEVRLLQDSIREFTNQFFQITPWTDFSPQTSNNGSLTWTKVETSNNSGLYKRVGNILFYNIRVAGTLGGSATNGVLIPLPVAIDKHTTGNPIIGSGTYNDSAAGGGFQSAYVLLSTDQQSLLIRKHDQANYSTSGTLTVIIQGFYPVLSEGNIF